MPPKQTNPKVFGEISETTRKVAIGIDQSLTGFAMSIVDVESPKHHRTYVYKSPYKGVLRLKDIQLFMQNVISTCSVYTVVDVAMEGTVLASHSALVLGELSATVKLQLLENKRAPLQIPPMTLKKYASGKGTSKKQEMLMQIYKRWGVEFNDDNAADAYALARLAGGIHIDAIEAAIIEQVKDDKYRDGIEIVL
jgi:Holliday junction resolvasome RuvABC endonuclease subunit